MDMVLGHICAVEKVFKIFESQLTGHMKSQKLKRGTVLVIENSAKMQNERY